MIHENNIIELFIAPDAKERCVALISNAKTRKKFIGLLAHQIRFDMRYITKIEVNHQSINEIEKILIEAGAPGVCYVISEISDIDGKEMNLSRALQLTVGRGMGTIITCFPSKLAYYEGEEAGERYILNRG